VSGQGNITYMCLQLELIYSRIICHAPRLSRAHRCQEALENGPGKWQMAAQSWVFLLFSRVHQTVKCRN